MLQGYSLKLRRPVMSSYDSNLLLLSLLLLPLSSLAQPSSNISLGTFLSTADDNASWVSANGDFAFGFLRLPSVELFLLAIWYANIPGKAVVWSANGGSPVQKGSRIGLTLDGQLVLSDHQGREIWARPKAVNSSNSQVASAAMLDTGNFVLKHSNSSYLWRSFSEPTDTILPTQVLELGGMLSSRLTESSYSTGRFQLRLLPDGNLVLNTIGLPTDCAYAAYYRSDTFGSGFKVAFNESGDINILGRDGTQLKNPMGTSNLPRNYYYRATLDFDGGFRLYSYPKNDGRATQWSTVSTIPKDICRSIIGDEGSGICGFNSYCKMGDDQRHSCLCPDGYSYFDRNEPHRGCKPDHFAELLQACQLDRERTREMFEMKPLENTDWPMADPKVITDSPRPIWDSEWLSPYSEQQCSDACLNDCQCAVAVTRNNDCWKKKLPLSNGRTDPSLGGKALIKVLKGNFTLKLSKRKHDKENYILVGSILLGGSAFLNVLFLLAIPLSIYFSKHKKLQKPQSDSSMLAMNLQSFSYREIEEITDGFKEELGRGSFATVYKGVLTTDHRMPVAVKKLEKMEVENEKGFKNEVSSIGRTHHKNLVRLLGFCEQGPYKLLVYEFMSNGSLADFLFVGSRPRWDQRLQIASGIARGLMYLHEECSSQIIHCDIKPQNILLDERFTAKISDFGVAKLLKTDHSQTTTAIRGTRGYVAPEWLKNVMITAKIDVYSFGVLLLEIICCRKNLELNQGEEDKVILTLWAYECYKKGRIDMLVDYDEEALNDAGKLKRLVMVAIWCIQEEPSLRPSMKKVTEMIEGEVEVAVPPDPSSFISKLF